MSWKARTLSGVVVGLILTLLVFPKAVAADDPWGHAANHGYSGVDVTRHLLSSGTQLHRHTDGSVMVVSHYAPNAHGASVSFHDASGTTRTAYSLKDTRHLNSCLGNNCAKSGYHLNDVPTAERAKWAAQGLIHQAAHATMNTTPPVVPLVPGWMELCDWSRETVETCQQRLTSARKG